MPRQALEYLMEQQGIAPDDLDFKARFAAAAALQLGWAALEDFVALLADVPDRDRDELRDRIGRLVELFELVP